MNFKIDKKNQFWEIENEFYHHVHPTRIQKLITHYEAYKKIVDIPGDIAEFGVLKGCSIIRLAIFRKILENDFSRSIVGFDSFGNFPTTNLSLESDIKFVKKFSIDAGKSISKEKLDKYLKNKKIENYELVKGDIFKTVPSFLNKKSQTRFALIHLDLDCYEPTKFVLENIHTRLVKGAIVLIDDYGAVEGSTLAIDQFCKENKFRLKFLKHYDRPAYFKI